VNGLSQLCEIFKPTTAVLHHAQHHLNLAPIVAITLPDNHRSIELLQKLGLHSQEMMSLSGSQPARHHAILSSGLM